MAETTHAAGEPARQYLIFQVLGNRYAIDILEIREIVELSNLTRVPGAQPAIRGVMNLRGNVAPVIDLAQRLQNQDLSSDQRAVVLVVDLSVGPDCLILGMLVSEVNEILEIGAQDTQAPPDFVAGIRRDFVARMASVEGRFVILLDLQKVLDIEELSQMALAAGQEAPHALFASHL